MNIDDKQKQIEEMAKVIIGAVPVTIQYVQAPANETEARIEAKALIAAGYRKQSDTVREFVEKVLKIGSKRPLCLFNEYGEGYIDCIENIKKIAAEYGVEVEE